MWRILAWAVSWIACCGAFSATAQPTTAPAQAPQASSSSETDAQQEESNSAAVDAVTSVDAPPAPGDVPDEVDVVVDRCLVVPRRQLHQLLRLELGPSVKLVREARQGVATVLVRCKQGTVEMLFVNAQGEENARRTIARTRLRQVEGVRLLALAVAELVVATWLELSLKSQEAPEAGEEAALSRAARLQIRRRLSEASASEPPSAAEVPKASTPRAETPAHPSPAPQRPMAFPLYQIAGAVTALQFPGSAGPTLLGARAAAAVRFPASLSVEGSLEGVTSEEKQADGHVDIRLIDIRVLLRVDLVPPTILGVTVAMGGLLGQLSVDGNPEPGVEVENRRWVVAAPIAQMRLWTLLPRPLGLGVVFEAGWLAPNIRIQDAAQRSIVHAAGLWVGAAVEVGLTF